MSLIESMFVPFVRMVPADAPDGMGGRGGGWTEGAGFEGVVLPPAGRAYREAQRPAVRERLRLVTPATELFAFHDVIRRASDGAVFRVLSDGRDLDAPEDATVVVALVDCERWALT